MNIAHFFLTTSGSFDFNTISGTIGLIIALVPSLGFVGYAVLQPTFDQEMKNPRSAK